MIGESRVVSVTQSTAGRVIWRKGLDDMPPGLRSWDPGVDGFGVPYLGVTRHSDTKRKQMSSTVAEHSWCASCDPNVKSFHDVYVANSGSVVDVGRGWSERVYQKLGRRIDRLTSEMDQQVNQGLQSILATNPSLTMETLKVEKAKLVLSLEGDADYSQKSKSVRQVLRY
jgi:hypothetical protein